MSVLASLVRAYDRLLERGEVPPFGYSAEKISFLIPLNDGGEPAGPPIDLREIEGNRKSPRLMRVPASFKRPGTTPRPFFLWDNTAFALGVSANENKAGTERFDAFRKKHVRELGESDDPGLKALLRFVNSWQPDDFERLDWPGDMKDKNVVFALESERRERMIHDRPVARKLWEHISTQGAANEAVCLITGKQGPIERIHPPIRGIRPPGSGKDADSIVSFNLPAFESYGHEQGDNSPVSKTAAFKYVSALNRFLERDSGHRIQIGDASTVFWADASDADAANEAEDIFASLLGVNEREEANKPQENFFASLFRINEKVEAKKLGELLEALRQGRPIPELERLTGVRLYVLGLSPNAARLSVRFFIEDDFTTLTKHMAVHFADLVIEPSPFRIGPPIWALLSETALHVAKEGPNGQTIWRRPKDATPPASLSGDLMRSVLTGGRYPRTLLSRLIQRVRAERGRVNAARAAICKAIINRNARLSRPGDTCHLPSEEDISVALDTSNPNAAYRLGRLFALMESAQKLALPDLNATIRDRFFAAASTTPARVFPLLVRTAMYHLSSAEKDEKKKRIAFWLEKSMGEVWSGLEANLPRMLHLEDQGRFQVGYYHQRFAKKDASGETNIAGEEIIDGDSAEALEE